MPGLLERLVDQRSVACMPSTIAAASAARARRDAEFEACRATSIMSAGKALDGEAVGGLDVALGALADIFHFRQGAQLGVPALLQLGLGVGQRGPQALVASVGVVGLGPGWRRGAES